MNRRVFRNSLKPSNMDVLLQNTFPIYQPEYTCCKYLANTKQTSLDETFLLSIQEIMLKLGMRRACVCMRAQAPGKKIHKHCVYNPD